MSVTPAILSVGLWVPNHHFARPSDVANVPAGWTVTGLNSTAFYGGTSTASYAGGPPFGHPRWQRFSLIGTNTAGTVRSAPTPRGKFCASGTGEFYAGMLIRTLNTSTSTRHVRLALTAYDTGGTSLGNLTMIDQQTTLPSWTWVSNAIGQTLGTGIDHFRYLLQVDKASGDANIDLDIAQVAVGMWDAAAGSVTTDLNCDPTQTTPCVETGEDRGYENVIGERRHIDLSRYVNPRAGRMGYDYMSAANTELWRFAWMMNHGKAAESAASKPAGGRSPIIIVPGLPSWPYGIMVDLVGGQFPLNHAEGWMFDPPRYSGAFEMLEAI